MSGKKGFTLLEVLVVVIIIGILSALGWSSMNELIQTNKAKDAARTITAFAERAVAEGKMRKEQITIKIVSGNTLEARLKSAQANQPALFTQTLTNGFSTANKPTPAPTGDCAATAFDGDSIISQLRIGLSDIDGEGRFTVCNAGGNYCGSAVKKNSKNTFISCVRKRSGIWEVL